MKYNLKLFAESESRTALLRNAFGDYAQFDNDGKWELLGAGFTKLDESPGATTDSEVYINEVTSSASVNSYETTFEYETRLIPSQRASYRLQRMGLDHATGAAAELDYIRVDLFNPIGTTTAEKAEYTARKFRVVNSVSSIAGNGGEKLNASGSFLAMGDPVKGKFDTVTRTFTAGEFVGKYDETATPTAPEASG